MTIVEARMYYRKSLQSLRLMRIYGMSGIAEQERVVERHKAEYEQVAAIWDAVGE